VIIDALTHITRDGRWFDTGLDASLEALLGAMQRGGVDKAVLVGVPGADDDALLLDAVRAHPGRFIPVAGVDVSLGSGALYDRLEQVKAAGFVGVKLHPRLSGLPMTHPKFREVTRRAGQLGLCVMLCTIHRPPLPALGRPVSDALYEFCGACPDTRIILVHGGYTDVLATSELMRPLEHVLLDLSLTLSRFGSTSLGLDMAWLFETFDRRICLGSDFPETDMSVIRSLLTTLKKDEDFLLWKMSENLCTHLGLCNDSLGGQHEPVP
jgi:predicted TIM-barrel fold metal-dependent hydrolase